MLICVLLAGCASFDPQPLDELDFVNRVQTQEQDGVTVTVSVLTRQESRAAFGKKLDKNLIQPVWIEIKNNSQQPLWLMLHGLDPDYFSASEAAALTQSGGISNANINKYFEEVAIDQVVPQGGRTSGFVFSNLKQGTKEVRVRLLGNQMLLDLNFYVSVPGLRADWQRVDFQNIYSEDEVIDFEDPVEFRTVLEEFLCCTTKKDGSGSGDPINLVVVAPSRESLLGFIKAGWDEAEIITAGSSWRTAKSFLTGGEYKYSPISALYIFQRPQDISLQKARDTINERNHLRLWLAPWRYQGNLVFIGGISRDIGVFWTTRTWNLTSHAIDSEIDEARNYVTEDLATAQALSAYGFIGGVGETTPENPKKNLLGTPWWTDGGRAVLLLSDTPVPLEQLDLLDWTVKLVD
jgi:hypothetical protein